jgi:hypothetical protein
MSRLGVWALAVAVVACTQRLSSAAIIVYGVFLDGPSEFPPVPTPGTGTATITYDDVLHTLRVQASFQNLVGTSTVAHIHATTAVPFTGLAGVAVESPTFSNYPVGVTAGSFDQTVDLTLPSVWSNAFLTANGGTPAGAEAGLAAAMASGRAYLNFHSTFRPGGEIRGFTAPEPGTLTMLGLGTLGLAGAALRRRKRR